MMLDFNDDRTYTKDVVLANVRYALLDPKSLQDNAFSAEFLDMAVVLPIVISITQGFTSIPKAKS